MLQSTYIDREKNAAIMLGQSPERDHEIEAIQTTIRNCAAAGIRTLKYNMSILGVPRDCRNSAGARRHRLRQVESQGGGWPRTRR